MADAVDGQVGAMGVSQIGQPRRALDTERSSRGSAQFGAGQDSAVIGEADEARVKRRIPQCRKEQAIVHIEPLRVVALGPRQDVGGAQQGGVGNADDRAAAAPVIHQRSAEDVLADALDDEALDLGDLRQAGDASAKSAERCLGQADAQPVNPVERGVERR